MSLLDLPDEVFATIVKKLGDEDYHNLGPIIRSNKKGRDVGLSAQILQTANIDELCRNPEDIYPGSSSREFFNRCLGFENVTAIYYEALRLICKEHDVQGSLSLLNNIIPVYGNATLAYGMFQMCAGRGDIAGSVLQLFIDEFAGTRCTEIYSEVVYDMCEELIRNIMSFAPPCIDSFGFVWEFPSCDAFGIPTCEEWHGDSSTAKNATSTIVPYVYPSYFRL